MTVNSSVPVLTIDGPVASGKGTVASRVAVALGFHYLDSGVLFRACGLKGLLLGLNLDDAAVCAKAAREMSISFAEGKVLLDGQDVTDRVRSEEVGMAASRVAVHPGVRAAVLDLELSFRQAPGLVADGRDMGEVVFPDAQLKVFLTASVASRAQRRYKQLIQKGISANLPHLVSDLAERDRRDRERAAAPLKPAAGARILDSSDLTIEETVETVLSWWRQAAVN